MQQTTLLNRLSSAAVFIAGGHLSLELFNNFLPVAYPLFIERIGLSYSQIGTIALVAVLAGTLLQPFFGYLADRFDPRLIVVGSVLWIGTIMGLVGLVHSYWLLVLVVGLGGLGSAAFHPAGAALASVAAKARRGASMSLFSVGGNLGGALSPLLVGAGLVWLDLRATALLIPLAWLTGFLLYRQMDYWPAESRPANGSNAGPIHIGPWPALVLVILMAGARSWFLGGLTTYLPEWLQEQDWSLEVAGTLLSVLLIATSVGSLTGGTLSDRVGRAPIMFASMGLAGPAQWLLLNSAGWLQILAICLIGILIGATFPVTVLMAQEVWPGAVGLASSLVIGFGWLPAGFGSWTVGRLADQVSLPYALATLTLVPLIGLAAVVLFVIRYRHRQN